MKLKIVFLAFLATFVPSTDGMGGATKQDVMNYLWSIWGRKTISGHHNRQPLQDPTYWTRQVQDWTGKTPGLWGSDFLFGDDVNWRERMIDVAKEQWRDGSLVTLMINVCPPFRDENCSWQGGYGPVNGANLSDSQWQSLLTDVGQLNRAWKQRLDTYAYYLKKLQDDNIVVLFRPFQEINGKWFWWGAQKDRSVRLYRLTHNYLSARLNNLIWVWCFSDEGYHQGENNITAYYPGDDFVDIAALDVYDRGNERQPTQTLYDLMRDVTRNGKLLALGEVGTMPTPKTLRDQPKWVYFLQWSEYLQENVGGVQWNTRESVRETYNSDITLERGELGTWW